MGTISAAILDMCRRHPRPADIGNEVTAHLTIGLLLLRCIQHPQIRRIDALNDARVKLDSRQARHCEFASPVAGWKTLCHLIIARFWAAITSTPEAPRVENLARGCGRGGGLTRNAGIASSFLVLRLWSY